MASPTTLGQDVPMVTRAAFRWQVVSFTRGVDVVIPFDEFTSGSGIAQPQFGMILLGWIKSHMLCWWRMGGW